MNILIRKATEQDFNVIFALIKELAGFVRKLEKVTNSVEQMKNEKDLFQCLVAENESNEIIGYALYFFAYFTWVGKSLYLDDLYVKESFRGQKIGTKLLKKIFKIAKEERCKRVRLQVRNWNNRAIDFYKTFNGDIDFESLNCDFKS